jgi:hypothetical protein
MTILHNVAKCLVRSYCRLFVRYQSARVVYWVARHNGNGRYISAVWFTIQLLTNQIAHSKITFKDL